MPSFFHLRGYAKTDPLDDAPVWFRFLSLTVINAVLSCLLLYVIVHTRFVAFNGFHLAGHAYGPETTMALEVVCNSLLWSPLIVLTRKCSSLIPCAIAFLPYFFLDLYIESHYRIPHDISTGLWNYFDDSPVAGIHPAALKFFVNLSCDAVIFGLIGLFLARLLAGLWFKRKGNAGPTAAEYASLFRKEWSDEAVAKPARDLPFYLLRILGFGYLIYLTLLIVGLLGPAAWPKGIADLIEMTYENPALAINTYFKITLMIVLAFTAAYNKELRFHACSGLLAGHVISAAYSLVFHFSGRLDTSDPTHFLLTSAMLDGALCIFFIWWIIRYKKDAVPYAPEKDFPVNFSTPLTLTKNLYKTMFVLFCALVAGIVCLRIFSKGDHGLSAVFGSPDPMIGNTVTLYATLAVLSFFLIKRERLRPRLFNAVVVPLLFGALTAISWIILGGMHGGVWIETRHGGRITADWYFVLYGVANVLLAVAMIGMRRLYYRVDYAINTLGPSAAEDAMALTQALFEVSEPHRTAVLQSIDQYVGGIRGRKRGLLNLPFGLFENVLNFIYGLRPAFSSMARDEQRFYLRKYFFRDDWERRQAFVPPLAEAAFTIGTALHSIVGFANYSYPNARADIGYVPADARDRLQADFASSPPPFDKAAPLPRDENDPNNFKAPATAAGRLVAPRVTTPLSVPEIPESCDYLVVGSGAGGATAAYRLACAAAAPEKILVVESGARYQPLQDFSDSEIDMMKKVYKEGGLQQTKKTGMTVLQGECVGGSTVVNNAVCFRIPAHVRETWRTTFGLSLDGIDAEYEKIEKELGIAPLGAAGINARVAEKFAMAVSGYNSGVGSADPLGSPETVSVNHLGNTGDGNWNLGNKRMRKRSMLETYIPWAESRGVGFLPNVTAVRFVTSADQSIADQVILRAANGALRKITVNKAIVVSAGAIASSHFLMRSEVPNAFVGRRLSCNFAFPVAFDFTEEIKAFDGDQITKAALDAKNRSAFETYFNPPATFSLTSIPFYFDRRGQWMKRYSHLLNFGSLLGSEANGQVLSRAGAFSGQAFAWNLGETDFANIKYALKTLIQLGKAAGSTRAMIPTRPGIDLDLSDESNIADFLATFDRFPLRMKDLYIGTAHPQGGNMMAGSSSSFAGQRVVTEDFRVDGYKNVFVADASLFPGSITVNPQLTIMAMSSMAAKSVLKNCPA